ncbi:MAG: response regulator [Chitinophagaceae bacterium]|nr:response regulator [Chitinophagaceae bacterium]
MNRTILSINTNRSISFLLHTVLADRYELITVSDAYSAMMQIKSNESISLIIADIDNGGNDIWDFIEHIGTSYLYNRPVMLLSSNRTKEIETKAMRSGVVETFWKPFSPPDMVRKVDSIMTSDVINN